MADTQDKIDHPIEQAASLDEHRALLEKAQEVAHVGSWVVELDGSERLTWSAETHRIFDVTVGSFPGTVEAFWTFVHPEDLPAVRAASHATRESGAPYDVEHRIVTTAGHVRWVHERADVIQATGTHGRRMIGTVQDITDRRALEEQLRHSQKMEAVGRLAGGVAHDLNNALTAVVGYTELALAELQDDHPARADVAEIRHAAERAAAVARQLLSFARRQIFEPRLFDLNETIAGLAGLLTRTLGHDITFRTELAPHLPPILGDQGQIEQAIVNLAVNARDAMPDGGQLMITSALQEVDDAFARTHVPMPTGRFIAISVADTGHGLDAETQAQVFEPFFTTRADGEGTGLGLAMVYSTIKQTGGFIFVESEVGHGATFRLYFPPAGQELQEAPHDPAVADPHEHTILVVEDEPLILHVVIAALRADGYQVLSAESGPDALALVASSDVRIDLLLTDAMMPGMQGTELAGQLLAGRPDLPVIVMSGYKPGPVRPIGNGRFIYAMQKPFTPDEVRAKVREALRR